MRVTSVLSVLIMVLLGWDDQGRAAACPALDLPLRGLPTLGDPLRIVALGSSSTEGAGASGPAATYPARLEALLRAAWPGRRVEVVNAGRSGETSGEMLARLGRDVLAREPQLVIWQAGGNEALRQGSVETFRERMGEGLARLRDAGIPVVLMDNQRSPRLLAEGRGALFDAELAALAGPGVAVFSRAAAMRRWEAMGVGPLNGPDGLHQTDLGYECLAAALARSLVAAAPWQPVMHAAQRAP
jgi:lysophospholipase L1-like esterase